VIPRSPSPVYELEDLNKQPIDESFYQEELTPVVVTKQTQFKIDKILSTRVRRGIKEHKVRWLGYGPVFDSWVKASDIVKLCNADIEVDIDSFYITLFSKISVEKNTLNSQTKFTNRLALPVNLGSTSEWEVGLCEISYAPPKRMILQGALVDMIGGVNYLVYSELVTPQLVGSEVGRVLRTIIAPSHTGQHLFSTIYYIPVQSTFFTNIHIELTFVDHARPVVFSDDDTSTHTKIVLHFRRTKWEKSPAGIDPCATFQIDKIVDTRSRLGITEDLVKWKGWDSLFNSWLPKSHIHQGYGNPPKSVLCHALQ